MSSDPLADAAVDATFAALAVPLTYRPQYGQPVTVRAVHVAPSLTLDGLGGGRLSHDGLTAQIRAVDLAHAPAEGDQAVIDQRRYRVRSARWADTARLVWEIEAVPC